MCGVLPFWMLNFGQDDSGGTNLECEEKALGFGSHDAGAYNIDDMVSNHYSVEIQGLGAIFYRFRY
jgi:hypothetical protein